ncbi:CoA transferase [Verticiella sediminum]|uniref:CoA transferase n=1 Tax=Verticiella sediminum TaxID=1247510 RepID=A0A556ARI6_9BURK|nr:CoA transferase [Verticiella sediminum]TSH95571.1 CoA transferase [Verticiella sediminum]
MSDRQLKGIRVLDMSRVLAGPLIGQMLGDLGAEVIKVERPGVGDESRFYGPPFFDPDAERIDLESAIYIAANRNKKAMAVDFTRPEGQELLRRLAERSDVLIENYKVGTLEKYGLDYESLRAINPRLIYCSVTGYGQTGPNRHRPGYDAIFQAEGGLMHSIGHPDGAPGAGPMRVGFSMVDVVTSLYAEVAVLSALYRRDANGGSGEHIDISLLESCVALTSHHAAHYLMSGQLPVRRGNMAGGGGVPAGMFPCKEGNIVITVGNDQQYRRFCEVIERPDLAIDPRFSVNQARASNREAMVQVLNEVFATASAKEWLERLVAGGIAAGQVNDLAQVFQNEQVRQRGTLVETTHRSGKALRMVATPFHFRNAPVSTYAAPPRYGEHTRQILQEVLGLGSERLEALQRDGVVDGTPSVQQA